MTTAKVSGARDSKTSPTLHCTVLQPGAWSHNHCPSIMKVLTNSYKQ